MKLEYFPQSKSKPVLLIYDGTPEEVTRLQTALCHIPIGVNQQTAIHLLPGIEPIDGCELFVGVSRTNEGIKKLSNTSFAWLLTAERWGEVAEMLEGSKEPWRGGHAFLETSSKISVIISGGRGW